MTAVTDNFLPVGEFLTRYGDEVDIVSRKAGAGEIVPQRGVRLPYTVQVSGDFTDQINVPDTTVIIDGKRLVVGGSLRVRIRESCRTMKVFS